MQIRQARPDEAAAIARLVNEAYEVERFFVEGDRTSEAEVRQMMAAGTFLVSVDEAGRIEGCVHLEVRQPSSSFGMLAVAPSRQGAGRGKALIAEAERRARAAGSQAMEILVVDLRTDLRRFYAGLGYSETGRAPYVDRPVTQPTAFVVMSKSLAG